MNELLPDPLVPAECDCTDLDGFLLNVERLMGSELVALASHEVIGAALLLWCRAWKQRPAASLPDNDQVLAAFARMTLARWRKVREAALRGFVRCADGRLYHRVLAQEALRAWQRKLLHRERREAEAERVRKWRQRYRERNDGAAAERPTETRVETRTDMRIETRSETADVTRSIRARDRDSVRDRDRDSVRDKRESSLRSDSPATARDDLAAAVAGWNALADELGLARVQRLNRTREARLRARLADGGGLAGFEAALAKIRGSPFLRGERRDWRASFDFMLQESSFIKLLEGAYDDHRANGGPGEIDDAIGRGLGLDRVPAGGAGAGGDGELFGSRDRGG